MSVELSNTNGIILMLEKGEMEEWIRMDAKEYGEVVTDLEEWR